MTTPSTAESANASNRTVITICVMMATLMQTLDTTIVNVAMPYIQGSLAASPDQITWVLTSYIVAAAIMTPPIGWLSARFGRKNLRGGPGCLNRFSASISGASTKVRLPSGGAAA
jgi:DHA2 family multidrug resistance protein